MLRLLYVPSFYGALGWWTWFIAYLVLPLGWDTARPESIMSFVVIGVAFSVSALIAACSSGTKPAPIAPPGLPAALVLAGAGVSGIVFHLYTLAQSFHGMPNVLRTLLRRSFEIRWENADVTSIGTQVSYIGWLACGLLALIGADVTRTGRERLVAISAWFVVVGSNLAMVDRTRPFWIILTSILVVLSSRVGQRARVTIITSIATACVLVGTFVGVALWSGKIGDHSPGRSTLEAAMFNVALYGTGGFAYFDRISTYHSSPSLLPERTLYPFYKALAGIGLVREPPSQILDFEAVPHDVNVGTIITPLYLDGGWQFVIVLLPFVLIGVDRLGLAFLRSTRPIQRYAWAAFCYSQLFAFFSRPLTGTPCWWFVCAGLISMMRESSNAVPFEAGTTHPVLALSPTEIEHG